MAECPVDLPLAAETHQTIGCEEIITPPLKMMEGEEALISESRRGRFDNIGQLLLYRPIRSQDIEVIERAARDKYKAKCREVGRSDMTRNCSL